MGQVDRRRLAEKLAELVVGVRRSRRHEFNFLPAADHALKLLAAQRRCDARVRRSGGDAIRHRHKDIIGGKQRDSMWRTMHASHEEMDQLCSCGAERSWLPCGGWTRWKAPRARTRS